jgi:hypothetical protein
MRNYKIIFLAIVLLVWSNSAFPREADDDTLRFYLTKSDLAVSGTIISEPAGFSSESGIVVYQFKFKVSEALAGKPPKSKEISVGIARFERGAADRLFYMRKGSKCILFLKNNGEGADFWFAIQPFSSAMARSLKRLSQK